MAERSRDWFRPAEADLRHARNAREDADYNWSAFASHQAAEKAMKAVFHRRHLDAWGHTLSVLLENLPQDFRPPTELMHHAKQLDQHDAPSLRPSGFERGAPVDFYTGREADLAVSNAEAILEWCRRQVAR